MANSFAIFKDTQTVRTGSVISSALQLDVPMIIPLVNSFISNQRRHKHKNRVTTETCST